MERRYNAPLLAPGTRLVLPAGIKAVPVRDYYHRPRLAPAASAWPHMRAADGTTVDASVVPERGAPTRIAMLSGFTDGWYELRHANGRADRVTWDASTMPFLWLYGEFGATQQEPVRPVLLAGAAADVPQPLLPRHHHQLGAACLTTSTGQPRTQDISDVYCFAGPSDDDGPRTVIAMNASPQVGAPWDPSTFYELKLDLNDDFVEDITWRFTFSQPDSTGNQYVQVAQLTGADATSRTAPGKIITPPNAPVGEVLHVNARDQDLRRQAPRLVLQRHPRPRADAGRPADPWLTPTAPNPDLPASPPSATLSWTTASGSSWSSCPPRITGLRPDPVLGEHRDLRQGAQRLGPGPARCGARRLGRLRQRHAPHLQTINGTEPTADLAGRPANPATDPASGVWGTVRDQVAGVVKATGNVQPGQVHGQPTPMAYGAFVADTLLPNVLRYTPGTTALWDPWNGVRNGKGLHEELASNFARMVINDRLQHRAHPAPGESSTTSPTSPRPPPAPADRL